MSYLPFRLSLSRSPGRRAQARQPDVPGLSGVARVDRRTKDLTKRLKADPYMEGVEKVRLMLGRNFLGKRAQTILISSASAGEGKTTLAGHLAVSLTRADRKTIIVDADLRRPALHEHLGLAAGPGVCELLRGEGAAFARGAAGRRNRKQVVARASS